MKKFKFVPLLSMLLIVASCSKVNNISSISSSSSQPSTSVTPEVEKRVTTVDSFKYYINDNDTVQITGLDRNDYDEIIIPDYIDGRKVTQLSTAAFDNNNGAKRIYINKFLDGNYIDGSFFKNFDNLEKIEVSPDNTAVEVINNCVIKKGDNLAAYNLYFAFKSSTIPTDRNIEINGYAFGYTNIEDVYIPKNVTKISDDAFFKNYDLKSFRVEEGNTTFKVENNCLLKNIGNGWAVLASSLNSTIPTDTEVWLIAPYAFQYSKIKKLHIPKNIREIRQTGLANSEIEELTFDDDTQLHDWNGNNTLFSCLNNLPKLKSIRYPKNITTIAAGTGGNSLANCTSLETLYIPKTITSISPGFASTLTSLKTIVLEAGNTMYEYTNGFLIDIKNNILAYYNGNEENVTIPSNVTTIASYAFYNNKNIKNVTIPSSLTKINSYAFANTSLETLIFSGANNIATVGSYAFSGCKNIKTVSWWPSKVTTIPANCFDSSKIETLKLPVTITTITNSAFNYAEVKVIESSSANYVCKDKKNLTNADGTMLYFGFTNEMGTIDIPSTVTSIAANACYGREVKYVVIPSSVTTINDHAFAHTKSLKMVVMSDNVLILKDGCFYQSSIKSINLSAKLQTIEKTCFESCVNLEEIHMPNTLTSLGINTFLNSGLKRVTISSGLKAIASQCFKNTKLENIVIPSGVTSIDDSAFATCYELKSVSLPNTLTTIASNAFKFCSKLVDINLPDSITSIGSISLHNVGIEEIIVPKGVTSIANYAFRNTKKLKRLVLTANVTKLNQSILSGSTVETVEIKNPTIAVTTNASLIYDGSSSFYNARYIKEIKFYGALDQFKAVFKNEAGAFTSNFDDKVINITYLNEQGEFTAISSQDIDWNE